VPQATSNERITRPQIKKKRDRSPAIGANLLRCSVSAARCCVALPGAARSRELPARNAALAVQHVERAHSSDARFRQDEERLPDATAPDAQLHVPADELRSPNAVERFPCEAQPDEECWDALRYFHAAQPDAAHSALPLCSRYGEFRSDAERCWSDALVRSRCDAPADAERYSGVLLCCRAIPLDVPCCSLDAPSQGFEARSDAVRYSDEPRCFRRESRSDAVRCWFVPPFHRESRSDALRSHGVV